MEPGADATVAVEDAVENLDVENLVAEAERWTAKVRIAGEELAELESAEGHLLKSNQSVIRSCWLQIGFFAAIINGIAVLINGATRVPSSLPCWTVSFVVLVTAGLLFGLTIPIGFGFRKLKEFRRDSQKYTVKRMDVRNRATDLINMEKTLRTKPATKLILDQMADISQTVDKLRDVMDEDLIAQYNQCMFKKNLIVVSLFGLLYVLSFPVGTSFMLCGGVKNNFIRLIKVKTFGVLFGVN